MEQNDIGCFSFLKMLVLNWNSHPCLMYVLSKSKVTQNISNLQAWHKNMQNGKSLFMWRHSLWGKKTQKTCQEWKHWASGHFMKLFYKTTTCTRRPLLSILKSGCLIQAWLYFWIRVCLWLFKYKSILWNFNSKNFQSTNFFYLNLRISLTYITFHLHKILTLM